MTDILHLGLGPLGRTVVRHAVERGLNIAGVVDPAEDIAGKALSDLCDLPGTDLRVCPSVQEALQERRAEVALVTTVSSLAKLEPQIIELAHEGLHIVSTCEELSYPWRTQPDLANRIDAVCKKHGVVCLGTGVNPGFLMDYLPAVLTGVCQRVDAVKVSRVQDASVRRVPFQQKIGAALTLEQFRAKGAAGALRHVGLPESLDMIACRIGWELDRKTESLDPVIAEHDVDTGYKPIEKGLARGVEQVARGYVRGKEVITLHFRAAVGEPESYDRIQIEGDPAIDSRIAGGVHGDTATVAITVNAIRSVLAATPGLKTMCDIPVVSYSEAIP